MQDPGALKWRNIRAQKRVVRPREGQLVSLSGGRSNVGSLKWSPFNCRLRELGTENKSLYKANILADIDALTIVGCPIFPVYLLLLLIDTRDELQIEREFFFGSCLLAELETKRAKMSDKFFKGRILDIPHSSRLAVIQTSTADPLPSTIYLCSKIYTYVGGP